MPEIHEHELLPFQYDFDLTDYNTFGFASIAERFVRLHQPAQVPALCRRCRKEKWPLLILGGGSNLVLADRIPGVVARMEIPGRQVVGEDGDIVKVKVAAGESWADTVEWALAENLFGMENLALIPGTVGAAPVQNIGAYGMEFQDTVGFVEVYDQLEERFTCLSKEECAFGYRDSLFKSGEPGRYIITAVEFHLSRKPRLRLGYASLEKECRELAGGREITPHHLYEAVCRLRRARLPETFTYGNAGSFFKNPVVSVARFKELAAKYPQLVAFPDKDGYKLAAGWLIEQCGWKGRRWKQVGVYEKQALVLINCGGGHRAQIEELAAAIQKSVWEKFGVTLEPEPRFYP
ncbi:MAG TPA: UDP-N-acetylmuramate dehydrogenase [Firmicutes bacterium]|nr:UDP-N-acetylmuramate dehydrogenase [Bacillota bacterium]